MTTMQQMCVSFEAMGRAAIEAGVPMKRWGDALHVEKIRQACEVSMVDWSFEERVAYQRRVRELHLAEPDLSLVDCLLRVGAAMEACRD